MPEPYASTVFAYLIRDAMFVLLAMAVTFTVLNLLFVYRKRK
jgi:hypothetical protein